MIEVLLGFKLGVGFCIGIIITIVVFFLLFNVTIDSIQSEYDEYDNDEYNEEKDNG